MDLWNLKLRKEVDSLVTFSCWLSLSMSLLSFGQVVKRICKDSKDGSTTQVEGSSNPINYHWLKWEWRAVFQPMDHFWISAVAVSPENKVPTILCQHVITPNAHTAIISYYPKSSSTTTARPDGRRKWLKLKEDAMHNFCLFKKISSDWKCWTTTPRIKKKHVFLW